MKTKLPQAITTIQEAEAFLTELVNNGEHYHPEDDAHDIAWQTVEAEPTPAECDQLNKLMKDIYDLPGNEHCRNMIFDPCEFILDKTNSGWRDYDDEEPLQDISQLSEEEFKAQHDKNFQTKYLKGEE